MNRSELQQKLIDKMIEGMDFKTMWSVLYDYMDESYDKYSYQELKTEVEEYYPELLEEDLDKEDDSWYTDPMSKASHHHY